MKIVITLDYSTAQKLLGDLIDLYSADEAHLVLPEGRPDTGIDDVMELAATILDAGSLN